MPDSKGKYQPWSHEEFMADRKVRRMTPTALKTYMMLLHEAFVCATRPNLPDDEDELKLMAYCTDDAEWLSVKEIVLGMFERQLVGGIPVLVNKRLTKDWNHLQEIRDQQSEAGKRGANKRWNRDPIGSPSVTIGYDSKEVSKESKEEKKVSEGDDSDMNLKALKASLATVAVRYRAKLGGFSSSWDDVKLLEGAYGSGALLRDFEEWLKEFQGDDFPVGALPVYLRVASDRLNSESVAGSSPAKDPEVVSLARELSYLSGGSVAFQDKQKIRLAETLKEFTAEEVTSVFKTWLDEQDLTDPKNLSYLPGKFVQIAGDKAYALRKSREVRSKDAVERELAVKRLQEEAEINRLAAEAVKAEESELFDPLAG